jgi:phage-related protein
VAIVGTAFVRLRVIGDTLKKDISDSTKKAVKDSAGELKQSGDDVGKNVSEGAGHAVERDMRTGMERIGDDIGNALGTAMGNSLGRSLRNRVSTGFRNSLNSGKSEVSRIRGIFKPVSDQFDTFKKDTEKSFKGFFKNAMVSGISLAAIAAPSALAFLGAGIGAVASTAVTALAALGPAFAGAGAAGIAAFGSVKLAVGLVGLALKTQTPALERFTKSTQAIKDAIGGQVQLGLFATLTPAIQMINGIVPQLSGNLNRMGASVGTVGAQFARMLATTNGVRTLNSILNVSIGFIDAAGPGLVAMGQALMIVFAHLGPIARSVGTLVTEAGRAALAFIQAKDATGELDSFLARVSNAAEVLGGALISFGIGIINVFRAASGASGGMITNLAKLATRFQLWTGNPANQAKMVDFFVRMRQITGMLIGVFGQLAGATARGLNSTSVSKFKGVLDTLVSVGTSLGGVFEQIRANAGDKLQVMFTRLADVIGQLAASGVIGTMTDALSNLFLIISTLLQIPGVGQLLAFVAGLAVLGKTMGLVITVAKSLWGGLKLLGAVIAAIAEVVGWPITIIGLLVAALVWFFTQTEIGRHIVEVVWDAIKTAIAASVGGIIAAWNWMMGVFQVVWGFIQTVATAIWQAVSTAFNAVVSAVTTAIQAVWNVITTVWTAVWGFIQPILQGIWGVIQAVFSAIVTVVTVALGILWAIWSRIFLVLMIPVRIFYGLVVLLWNAIFAGIRIVLTLLWNVITSVWNAIYGAISTALRAIWRVVTSVWNAVWGFIHPILQGIWTFISGVWNRIYNTIYGILFRIYAFIMARFYAIRGIINGVLIVIRNAVSTAWNAITGAIRNALNAAWNVVRTVWNRITGFVQGALNRLKGLASSAWSALGSVGSGVLGGLKAAANTVVGAINTVIGGLNWVINTANRLPGPDIPRIPRLPRLAAGGVVGPTGMGTLALIAEGGRSERVEPLDPTGLSARDRAIIDRLSGGSGGAPKVTVFLGTREIEDIIDVHVEDKEGQLASRVKTGTKG